MNMTFEQIEAELAKLVPAPIPADLLERLDGAVLAEAELEAVQLSGEKLVEVSPDDELVAISGELDKLVPYGMPEDMISRLDDAMAKWHEEVPVTEKVVPMYQDDVPQPRKVSSWPSLRSVAAVGLLGAAAAFFAGGASSPSELADGSKGISIVEGRAYSGTPVDFSPAGSESSVVSTNDHGVIWTKSGKPIQCLEVELNREIRFVNAKGEKLILRQPQREVRFTPIEVD